MVQKSEATEALRVTFHNGSSKVKTAGSTASAVTTSQLSLASLGSAAALRAGGSMWAASMVLLFTALALLRDLVRPRYCQAVRTVTLSFEPCASAESMGEQRGLAKDATPLWVGSWRLDKSCSDPYEPILAELGITYLLRKAIDAKTSTLKIERNVDSVAVAVTNLVTVVDVLPLDGTHILRPVPPGAKVKGTMKVRLVRHSTTELVLGSELPDGGGELLDTTTVMDGGAWLTRRTQMGQTEVTRVFRRIDTQ